MKKLITIFANDPTVIAFAPPHELVLAEASAPLPNEIVWMPIGEHAISAGTPGGKTWSGKVRVTEAGARAAQASFQRAVAAGRRPWIDFNHADAGAAAWVTGFSWDPARGIIASIEWTPAGERALREKQYRSFSPAFTLDRESGQVAGTYEGHAAGGLVNAPAFGAAMPALIAARLAGAESATPAPGGSLETNNTMTKEQLIALLASLGIQHAADATEQQLVALVLAHKPASNATAEEVAALKRQVEIIQASAKEARGRAAQAHVDAAVARGALKKEETAVLAFWKERLETNEETALAALNAIPGAAKKDAAVIVATHVDNPGSEITVRANGLEVIKAMQAEKDPLKQGLIYRDFRPIIIACEKAGTDPLVVLGTNTLGTLTSALITLRSLDLLKLQFPILGRIATDFSAEQVKWNQAITSRIVSVPTVGTYNTTTGYAIADTTTTDVAVTINAHKHITIAYHAQEVAGTSRNLFQEQVQATSYALAKNLVDALYALFVIGTYTNATTIATASITRITVPVAVAKALNARGVPMIGRTLLLNGDAFAKLAEDATIMTFAANQRADLITKYQLPELSGLQPIEAVNLPSTGNMTGFALTADAALIATRLPEDYTKILPGASHGVVTQVINPDTGFAVMKTDYVDHTLGTANSRIAWMYGVAAGQVASAQLIKSS